MVLYSPSLDAKVTHFLLLLTIPPAPEDIWQAELHLVLSSSFFQIVKVLAQQLFHSSPSPPNSARGQAEATAGVRGGYSDKVMGGGGRVAFLQCRREAAQPATCHLEPR